MRRANGSRSLRRRRLGAASLLVAIASGLLACAGTLGRPPRGPKPPRQGWDRARGPVIPHDRFPRDCSICHVGTSWREIKEDFRFDHERETGVPLEGAHSGAECLRCHNDRGPVSLFSQRGCAGCHEDVHRGKLGEACADCHGEEDWRPRGPVALHNATRFPLFGAHAAVACWRCHAGAQVGNFDRTDTECVACHGDDLARATNPDHLALGFVQDCERCHVPTAWRGATFLHPFPIDSGPHSGGSACFQCHPSHPNFSVFSCTGCHDQGETDDHHESVSGYSYNSQACYACHPDGEH